MRCVIRRLRAVQAGNWPPRPRRVVTVALLGWRQHSSEQASPAFVVVSGACSRSVLSVRGPACLTSPETAPQALASLSGLARPLISATYFPGSSRAPRMA